MFPNCALLPWPTFVTARTVSAWYTSPLSSLLAPSPVYQQRSPPSSSSFDLDTSGTLLPPPPIKGGKGTYGGRSVFVLGRYRGRNSKCCHGDTRPPPLSSKGVQGRMDKKEVKVTFSPVSPALVSVMGSGYFRVSGGEFFEFISGSRLFSSFPLSVYDSRNKRRGRKGAVSKRGGKEEITRRKKGVQYSWMGGREEGSKGGLEESRHRSNCWVAFLCSHPCTQYGTKKGGNRRERAGNLRV